MIRLSTVLRVAFFLLLIGCVVLLVQKFGRQDLSVSKYSHSQIVKKAAKVYRIQQNSFIHDTKTEVFTRRKSNNETFYKYLLNPAHACKNPHLLLVIVESTTFNAMERDYFRKRWVTTKHKGHAIVTVFATGRSDLDGAQELLQKEYLKHRDILQIDFEDSYRNLTLKTMQSLKWALEECKTFSYILKTDDDTIVNYDVLAEQLNRLSADLRKNLYMGLLLHDKPPIRNLTDKWHVTVEEFPGKVYPDYMSGTGYVLSHAAAQKILTASQLIPYMPMEDVYVGLCASKAGITAYSNVRFSNFNMADLYDYCWCRQTVIMHNPDWSVRELYYFDKYLDQNKFPFDKWESPELAPRSYYEDDEYSAYVYEYFYGDSRKLRIYNCTKENWEKEVNRSLHQKVVQHKIPRSQIITV